MKTRTSLIAAAVVVAACHDARAPYGPNGLLDVVNLPPVALPGGPYVDDGLVEFDGSGSIDADGPAPLSYAWDFGDGQRGTGPTPTHAYLSDGVYAVTLTVTDAQGATSLPGVTSVAISGSGGTAEVLSAAGNIAVCSNQNDEATAQLLDGTPGVVMALGDNAMRNGTLANYTACYEPTWGRHKGRTYATIGNHEYDSSATADGTFDYFGSRAGPRPLGYYSIDVGAWHVIVLNDNDAFVPFGAGSAQEQWLANDLAANPRTCTIVVWHQPRFLSSNTAGFTERPTRKVLWDRLYAAGVDVILNGHQHHYERMAPMTPAGARDDATGIRQFNVGTGGESIDLPTVTVHPNSEVRAGVFGVLKLTLRPTRYDWEFVPIAGEGFRDAGSGTCH